MKYRGVDFSIVQGIERQLWKWSISYEGIYLRGQATTKAEAVSEAERAIDRAMAPKKVKLVRPEQDGVLGRLNWRLFVSFIAGGGMTKTNGPSDLRTEAVQSNAAGRLWHPLLRDHIPPPCAIQFCSLSISNAD